MEKRMDETMDAEKFLKELIHRALLGDEQAQQACTDKGIALTCPFCQGEAILEYDVAAPFEYDVVCGDCGIMKGISEDKNVAIREWNTRPAAVVMARDFTTRTSVRVRRYAVLALSVS